MTAFFNSFAASQAQQNTQLLIQILQQQLAEANDKYADTKSELSRLKDEHATETQSLRQDLAAEKQQNSELKKQVAQLKERNHNLAEEAIQLQKKHEEFNRTFRQIDERFSALQMDIDATNIEYIEREQPEMKQCRAGSDMCRRRGESVISDVDYISADESTNDEDGPAEHDPSNGTSKIYYGMIFYCLLKNNVVHFFLTNTIKSNDNQCFHLQDVVFK